MAKLMSKKTKEIVQTTAVLVTIALLVIFYIIYPLIAVSKMTQRPDSDRFEDPEFTLENDASFFIDSGLSPDTFTVVTDDNIRLAAAYFRPDSNVFDIPRATALLIHNVGLDRTSMMPYIQPLLDSGIGVVIYDQRASGLSGGQYQTPGIFEAEDVNQAIINLKYHDRLFRPLIAVGFGIGADAALLSSNEESRLDRIIAVDPYLTPNRWLRLRTEERGILTIPFYKMVYYWWYKKITGFPYDRHGVDDIKPVVARTLLIMGEDKMEDEEIGRLQEIMGDLLKTQLKPNDDAMLRDLIVNNIYTAAENEIGAE